MKFTKSQRNIHQPNYNPPSNLYHTQHVFNNNQILTGSLAPPSFPTRNNTFGFQGRFQKEKSVGPGPGAYIKDESKLGAHGYGQAKGKVVKGKQLPNFGTTPSIPYHYYGQNKDEEEIQYIRELLMNQDISQASKTTHKKIPTFTFSKNPKSHTYIPNQTTTVTSPQQKSPPRPLDPNIDPTTLQTIEQRKKKNKIIWQQKIKRANQRRLQVIQSIDPGFVPSLELIQLIRKKTDRIMPGPADYAKGQNQQPEFQIYQNPKGVSFTSVKRFATDKPSNMGPGIYNPKDMESSKKYSFGKSSRNIFTQKIQSNFRFYINPQPQPQPQPSCTLRPNMPRSSSCPFGSKSTRFPQHPPNEGPSLTLEQQTKMKQNQKLNKIIESKLRAKFKNVTAGDEHDDGLLGISTMASTID